MCIYDSPGKNTTFPTDANSIEKTGALGEAGSRTYEKEVRELKQ